MSIFVAGEYYYLSLTALPSMPTVNLDACRAELWRSFESLVVGGQSNLA